MTKCKCKSPTRKSVWSSPDYPSLHKETEQLQKPQGEVMQSETEIHIGKCMHAMFQLIVIVGWQRSKADL